MKLLHVFGERKCRMERRRKLHFNFQHARCRSPLLPPLFPNSSKLLLFLYVNENKMENLNNFFFSLGFFFFSFRTLHMYIKNSKTKKLFSVRRALFSFLPSTSSLPTALLKNQFLVEMFLATCELRTDEEANKAKRNTKLDFFESYSILISP